MSSNKLVSSMATLLLCLTITMVATEKIYADLANDTVFTLTQADGTTFQARKWGDEWSSGTETEDGYSIVFDKATQNWMYAIHDFEGKLIASNNIVGKYPPPAGVEPFLRPIEPQIANYNPTFRDNRFLILPFVDLPQRGGAYQEVVFELTKEGEWQLLSFSETQELQHIDKVELIKIDSFPIQVFLRVVGSFTFDCQEIGQISSILLVNKFDIWMYPKKSRCRKGFTFTHVIPLPVYSLKKGEYEYSVNGRYTGTFNLDKDNKF